MGKSNFHIMTSRFIFNFYIMTSLWIFNFHIMVSMWLFSFHIMAIFNFAILIFHMLVPMFSNFHIMAAAVTVRVHRTMLQRLKLNTAVNILTAR